MKTLIGAADADPVDLPRVMVVDSERAQRDRWREAAWLTGVQLHFCQPRPALERLRRRDFQLAGVVINCDPGGIFAAKQEVATFIDAVLGRMDVFPLAVSRWEGHGATVIPQRLTDLLWPTMLVSELDRDYKGFLHLCSQLA